MTQKGKKLAAALLLVILILRALSVHFIDPASWLSTYNTDWYFIAAALLTAAGCCFFVLNGARTGFKPIEESGDIPERNLLAAAPLLLSAVTALAASVYTLYHAVYTIALVGFSRLDLALTSAYKVAPFSFWLGVAASAVGLAAAYALFIGACSYYRGNRRLFSRPLLFLLSGWYLLRTLWEFLGRSLNPHNSVYAVFLISTAVLAVAAVKHAKFLAFGGEEGRRLSAIGWSTAALLAVVGLAGPTLYLFISSGNVQMLLFETSDVFAALALAATAAPERKKEETH